MKLNAFTVEYLKNERTVDSKFKADTVELSCWYGINSQWAHIELPIDAEMKEVVKQLRLMANQIEKVIENANT